MSKPFPDTLSTVKNEIKKWDKKWAVTLAAWLCTHTPHLCQLGPCLLIKGRVVKSNTTGKCFQSDYWGACTFQCSLILRAQREAEMERSLQVAFWDERKSHPLSLETPEELDKSSEVERRFLGRKSKQVDKQLIKSLHLKDKRGLLWHVRSYIKDESHFILLIMKQCFH